jgi:DNA helicase-2/ATP-dependent DNA helicase PcrA
MEPMSGEQFELGDLPEPEARQPGEHREHRVIGPPGCGKTTYLSRQANRAADKVGSGEAVVVASLTRAAAREVAGRKTAIPQENIGTLHAHCFRALERPSLAETPDGLKAWNEWVHAQGLGAGWEMSGASKADLDHQPVEVDHAAPADAACATAAAYRARMLPVEAWPDDDAARFYEKWCEWKAESNRLDFTDLIEHCLKRRVHLPSKPLVMMLDEAQDMSRLEMSLARMWGEECQQLVIVGDPEQNLYEWRGSEPQAFFAAEAASEITLSQSYRVPADVHDYAVRWIKTLNEPRHFDYEPRDEQGEVRRLRQGAYTKPDGLVTGPIADDLGNGMSVMVLASCGYMLYPMISTLRAQGVPFHNPYRQTHGGWNPMRGVERLAAFLRPDKATWGESARLWSWEDMKAWVEPMKARGVLSHGAKTIIESRCLEGRFGEKPGEEVLSVEEFLKLFVNDEVAQHAWDLDVEWWQANLLASKAERLEYGVELYKRHGGESLRREPRLTIGTVHSVKGGEADCSPGDEPVLTTNRGWVPIEDLDPEVDRLVSFNSDHHKIHRGGPRRPDGYAFEKVSRPYDGRLLTLETDSSCTRVTPNHRLTVRWTEEALEAHVVYLMRRGQDWRLGVSQLHRWNGMQWVNGPSGRLSHERGDALWIVEAHAERGAALAAEARLAWSYGVPDLTFRAISGVMSQRELDDVWGSLDSAPGARRLMADFDLREDWPLWGSRLPGATYRPRQSGPRNRWPVRAANFLPGLMAIPTDPGRGQEPIWRTPTVRVDRFRGEVFSLDVERWHHYVSGGAVVHNSVYVWPDLSRQGYTTGWYLRPSRDPTIRLFYVAFTRAKHKLTLLPRTGQFAAQFPLPGGLDE